MPIYEYHCPKCKQDLELLIGRNETPACPQCGSKDLTRQLSLPASPVTKSNNLPMMPTCGRSICQTNGCQGSE